MHMSRCTLECDICNSRRLQEFRLLMLRQWTRNTCLECFPHAGCPFLTNQKEGRNFGISMFEDGR